jgi:fumarate reductase subunit D
LLLTGLMGLQGLLMLPLQLLLLGLLFPQGVFAAIAIALFRGQGLL